MRARHQLALAALGAPETPPPSRLTLLCGCFAAGIAIGDRQATPLVLPWAAIAALCAVLALLRRADRRTFVVALSCAVIALGAAWCTLRGRHVPTESVSAYASLEPTLVRIDGRALTTPEVRSGRGSMARFDFRETETLFQLAIDRVGGERAAGRVVVVVAGTVSPFRTGDRVTATGLLRRTAPAANPGRGRRAGTSADRLLLSVSSRALLRTSPAHGLGDRLRRSRDALRRAALGHLLDGLPRTSDAQRAAARDGLLGALLLGIRSQGIEEDAFRRVGVAHLLAISGLHLGIFVGVGALGLRGAGARGRVRAVAVIVLVLAYLMLVESRLPVVRAGVMSIAACAGGVCSRRLRTEGLVALSGLVLLVANPADLFTAGFQLSFGVVLGLVRLASPVRTRLFGPPHATAAGVTAMIAQWLATAVAASLVAWLVATPIVLHHFGLLSPLGVPLSLIALPVVAAVLLLGYAKIAIATALPSAALLLGGPLAVAVDMLLRIVGVADTLPIAARSIAAPSALWTGVALIWVWALCRDRARRLRRLLAFAVGLWLMWPHLPHPWQPALRIDMLAVSDGSCFVVRSGGRTMLFDAGSVSDVDVGRARIIPALRHLGVHRIEAIAVSHADLDHYSAVIDIADALPVGRVLITTHFETAAAREPDGPAAYLLDELSKRAIAVQMMHAGDTHVLGHARLRWIHPARSDAFVADNDASMVLVAEAASRRVLLTGDLAEIGIAALVARHPGLTADVAELPHHGSPSDATRGLLRQLAPSIVMQSTGWRRWANDTYADDLRTCDRLVTARDGACRVTIHGDGLMETSRIRVVNR